MWVFIHQELKSYGMLSSVYSTGHVSVPRLSFSAPSICVVVAAVQISLLLSLSDAPLSDSAEGTRSGIDRSRDDAATAADAMLM